MKKCRSCEIEHPLSEFHKKKDGANGYCSICKSCKRNQDADWYAKNQAQILVQKKSYDSTNYDRRREYKAKNWQKILVNKAKQRAKDKNFCFDLTEAWVSAQLIKQGNLCHFSRVPMRLSIGDKHLDQVSLDRLDPLIGYTQENTVLTCWGVNAMRNTAGAEETTRFLALIESFFH